jgi:hypothetical protein
MDNIKIFYPASMGGIGLFSDELYCIDSKLYNTEGITDYTGILVNSHGKFWYQYGKRHRVDGPAIEWADGTKEWYQDGKHHRLDGPAVERANGNKIWYHQGKPHRLDGPAYEYYNSHTSWYNHDKRHRIGGPAYEDYRGRKEWWTNGKQITKQTRIICIR